MYKNLSEKGEKKNYSRTRYACTRIIRGQEYFTFSRQEKLKNVVGC